MSRQPHWHSPLLPALFFSLLLHTALLPLWRQPSLPVNTALPSLQITLQAAPKTRRDHSVSRPPQTVTQQNTASPETKNGSSTPVSLGSGNHTGKPAKKPTEEIASAVQLPNIQRPDRRQRTRPLRKPPASLSHQPQPVIQRVHRKPAKPVVKPTHPQALKPKPVNPRSAAAQPASPAVANNTRTNTTASVRNPPITARSKSLTQPIARLTPVPATPAQLSRSTTQSSATAIPDNPAAPVPTKASNPASKSQVLTWLNQEIQKYFYYPGIARRRNLEGTVVLRFEVEQNGRIADARIAQSSGAGILDRAALASLHKLGSVTLPLGENLDLTLPVIYRLKERG